MAAEVRKSIRQKIFDAVKVRFEGIRQENGFATEIGKRCFTWRAIGTDESPFTTAELADAGVINISDADREPDNGVLTVHDQALTIEVLGASSAAVVSPPDAMARAIEADLLVAIGQDRQWTVDGAKLAKDTVPGKSTIGVGHLGDRVAWVRLSFTIRFRTNRFDPYTQ